MKALNFETERRKAKAGIRKRQATDDWFERRHLHAGTPSIDHRISNHLWLAPTVQPRKPTDR